MSDPESKSSPVKWFLLGCGLLILMGVLCAGGFVMILAKGNAALDPVTEAFVQRLNAEDYEGAYASIGPDWSQSQSQQEFEDFLSLVHDVLGPCQSRSTTGINFNSNTGGSTASAVYAAQFENGSGTIRATFNDNNPAEVWKVVGWRVESPLFAKALTCTNCNEISKDMAKFCPACGSPLLGQAEEETPADPDGEPSGEPEGE